MIVFKIALTPVQDFADLSGEIIFESMKRFITKPNLKMFAFDIAPEIIREKTTIWLAIVISLSEESLNGELWIGCKPLGELRNEFENIGSAEPSKFCD